MTTSGLSAAMPRASSVTFVAAQDSLPIRTISTSSWFVWAAAASRDENPSSAEM